MLDLSLYILTDRDLSLGRSDAEVIAQAISGGATIIQHRHKSGSTPLVTEEARELLGVCRKGRVPFIVNDWLDVALACGADGVHLGQDDLDVGTARHMAGPDFIIGVSVRTAEECRIAAGSGADYLAANGVFSTSTKTDFGEPLGLDGLNMLAEAAELPLVAIGGITAQNAADVIRAGADGVAVISYVVSHQDIAGRCRALLKAIENGRRTL